MIKHLRLWWHLWRARKDWHEDNARVLTYPGNTSGNVLHYDPTYGRVDHDIQWKN
jgi:hypothetical protein